MTYLETGIYNLITLSPIHIQAGTPKLYGEGFIRLNNSDDFLYVVDTPKLQAEIFAFKGLNAVKTYTREFSNPHSRTNITTVLEEIGYDYKSNIKKISKGIVRLPSGNRFMQSGLGKHFVPGSSIKGAIKTAVLYQNVQQRIAEGNLDLINFVENQINQYKRKRGTHDKRKFRESFAKRLMQDAFQSIHPWEHSRNPKRRKEDKGPFTDIFRAIKVKDAILKEPSEVQVEDVIFTTLNQSNQVDEKRMKGNTNFECFHGETKIEISIDKEILASFTKVDAKPPFSNLEELIQICQNFAQAQWKAEQQFLANYGSSASINLDKINAFYTDSENEKCVTLRVGWGTGMFGTTVSLLLDEPTRVNLRNEVISGGNHRRPKPAPKSRRFVAENGQPAYPLGWINLTKE